MRISHTIQARWGSWFAAEALDNEAARRVGRIVGMVLANLDVFGVRGRNAIDLLARAHQTGGELCPRGLGWQSLRGEALGKVGFAGRHELGSDFF